MKLIKPFQKSEYDRRIQDVKERMQRDGFDLLICQDPANMNWMTGFDGWSFYTPQAVLLHLEELSPTFEEDKDELEKIDKKKINLSDTTEILEKSDVRKNEKIYINVRALDKITAKTSSIKIAVGEKNFFGPQILRKIPSPSP